MPERNSGTKLAIINALCQVCFHLADRREISEEKWKKFKKVFIDISVIYARYNIHLG
jgi:hypothetical protein